MRNTWVFKRKLFCTKVRYFRKEFESLTNNLIRPDLNDKVFVPFLKYFFVILFRNLNLPGFLRSFITNKVAEARSPISATKLDHFYLKKLWKAFYLT